MLNFHLHRVHHKTENCHENVFIFFYDSFLLCWLYRTLLFELRLGKMEKKIVFVRREKKKGPETLNEILREIFHPFEHRTEPAKRMGGAWEHKILCCSINSLQWATQRADSLLDSLRMYEIALRNGKMEGRERLKVRWENPFWVQVS